MCGCTHVCMWVYRHKYLCVPEVCVYVCVCACGYTGTHICVLQVCVHACAHRYVCECGYTCIDVSCVCRGVCVCVCVCDFPSQFQASFPLLSCVLPAVYTGPEDTWHWPLQSACRLVLCEASISATCRLLKQKVDRHFCPFSGPCCL